MMEQLLGTDASQQGFKPTGTILCGVHMFFPCLQSISLKPLEECCGVKSTTFIVKVKVKVKKKYYSSKYKFSKSVLQYSIQVILFLLLPTSGCFLCFFAAL